MSLVWTVLIVLPFAPFSCLPPIIVGGGAGLWFVIAYLLFVFVGSAGFGWLSNTLYVIEVSENRSLDSLMMWLGFVFLEFGTAASCVLLGLGGALGGYASTLNSSSSRVVEGLLLPYVSPISVTVLVAVAGAASALLAMIRARGR